MSFFANQANSEDPDQKPHNAVSDQGLHCLLTECSIKFLMKNERALTGPIDKSGEFHFRLNGLFDFLL